MRKHDIAEARNERGREQPAVHTPVDPPRILFSAENNLIRNIYFISHSAATVKHTCHVCQACFTYILSTPWPTFTSPCTLMQSSFILLSKRHLQMAHLNNMTHFQI